MWISKEFYLQTHNKESLKKTCLVRNLNLFLFCIQMCDILEVMLEFPEDRKRNPI